MTALNIRTARRLGRRDGARIGEEVAEHLKRLVLDRGGVITPEAEDAASNLMMNKIGRAVKDVQAGGTEQFVAEQYFIAVIAECVARLRAHQMKSAALERAALH